MYLGMFIQWRKGPRGVNLHGTSIFLRRRTSVPLLVTEEGDLSIPRAPVSIWEGWREKSEADEDVFMQDFVRCGHKPGYLGPKIKWGMRWNERTSCFCYRTRMALTCEGWRGRVSLGSWCVCRCGNMGSAPGQEWDLGMAFPQKVPSVGQYLYPLRKQVRISPLPTWVGTISEQTEFLLLMYLFVSQGWWAPGTFGVPLGPTPRILMYNLMRRRHLQRTR